RVGRDVDLLALDTATIEREARQLDRAELIDPQLCVEVVVAARREFALAHSGSVDLAPRSRPADRGQSLSCQKFHVCSPGGSALWWMPSALRCAGCLHRLNNESTFSETVFRLT